MPPYFFGGGNVKIILCESGTSGAGKADAAATGVLLDKYEEGMDSATIDRLFGELKPHPPAASQRKLP